MNQEGWSLLDRVPHSAVGGGLCRRARGLDGALTGGRWQRAPVWVVVARHIRGTFEIFLQTGVDRRRLHELHATGIHPLVARCNRIGFRNRETRLNGQPLGQSKMHVPLERERRQTDRQKCKNEPVSCRSNQHGLINNIAANCKIDSGGELTKRNSWQKPPFVGPDVDRDPEATPRTNIGQYLRIGQYTCIIQVRAAPLNRTRPPDYPTSEQRTGTRRQVQIGRLGKPGTGAAATVRELKRKSGTEDENMKRFAGIFGLAALLGGLFLLFRPSPPEPERTQNPPSAAPLADASVPGIATVMSPTSEAPKAPELASATENFEFEIQNGRLISGPTVVKVHQGDRLRLRFRSNAADELHLHGYNLKAKLRAGTEASLEFEASKTGRFGFELHHAKADLGAIEVYPR